MAYNTLDDIKVDCPVCEVRSTHQLHIKAAASYSRGADGERFALRCYAVGDHLAWWPKSDSRYPEWRASNSKLLIEHPEQDAFDEWYRLTCPNCLSKLYVVIRYESLRIIGVIDTISAS